MSEENGRSESFGERLARLEASHVKLMTDHEVAWTRHEAFVAEQDREWERQQERWQKYDSWREEYKLRSEQLDKRIADLVSGFGAFIADLREEDK